VVNLPPIYKSVPTTAIARTPYFTPLLAPMGRTDHVFDVVDHIATELADVPSPNAVKLPPIYKSVPTTAIAWTAPFKPTGRLDHVLDVVDHFATWLI
jgi:hypothetical protein